MISKALRRHTEGGKHVMRNYLVRLLKIDSMFYLHSLVPFDMISEKKTRIFISVFFSMHVVPETACDLTNEVCVFFLPVCVVFSRYLRGVGKFSEVKYGINFKQP